MIPQLSKRVRLQTHDGVNYMVMPKAVLFTQPHGEPAEGWYLFAQDASSRRELVISMEKIREWSCAV